MKNPTTKTIPDWRIDPVLARVTTRKNELAAQIPAAQEAASKHDTLVAQRRQKLERASIRVLAGLTDAGDEGSERVKLDDARGRQAEAHDLLERFVGEQAAIDDELPRIIATARDRVLAELLALQRAAVEDFAPAIDVAYAAQERAKAIHAALLAQFSEPSWTGHPVLAPGIDVGLLGLAFAFKIRPETIERFKETATRCGCRI